LQKISQNQPHITENLQKSNQHQSADLNELHQQLDTSSNEKIVDVETPSIIPDSLAENKQDPQTELEKDDAEFVAEEVVGGDTSLQNTEEGEDKMDLT
jgi:hypothetical protein